MKSKEQWSDRTRKLVEKQEKEEADRKRCIICGNVTKAICKKDKKTNKQYYSYWCETCRKFVTTKSKQESIENEQKKRALNGYTAYRLHCNGVSYRTLAVLFEVSVGTLYNLPSNKIAVLTEEKDEEKAQKEAEKKAKERTIELLTTEKVALLTPYNFKRILIFLANKDSYKKRSH